MNGSPPSSDDPLDHIDRIRAELKSVTDDEEDTGVTRLPSDAPVRVRGMLAALFSLPPWGRTLVLLASVAGLFGLVWRFGPALISAIWAGR